MGNLRSIKQRRHLWKTQNETRSDKGRNLKVSESREIAERKNVYSRANGKQQLEFVDRMLKVTPEAQAPYLEESLEVEKYREGDFSIVIIAVVCVSRLLVVLEAHCRGSDTVRQDRAHHHHAKVRWSEDSVTIRWG